MDGWIRRAACDYSKLCSRRGAPPKSLLWLFLLAVGYCYPDSTVNFLIVGYCCGCSWPVYVADAILGCSCVEPCEARDRLRPFNFNVSTLLGE